MPPPRTALTRTQYWNTTSDQQRDLQTDRVESLRDVQSYLLPLDRARTAAAWTAGVLSGLRVTATAGAAGLQVGLGRALDGNGQAIVLEDEGVAITNPDVNPSPDAVLGLPTKAVGSTGVVVPTAGLTGERVLTVTWREAEVGPDSGPELRHAPWLRLVPTTGFTAGVQVPLATVTLDAGKVTAITAGHRVSAGVGAGALRLRVPRPAKTGLGVETVDGAEVRPRADGGLDVVPAGAENPLLSIDGANGRVGIGTATPEDDAALDVAGRVRVRQGTHPSPGIWFRPTTPGVDRSFVGMVDGDRVGFFGDGLGWGLTLDITSARVAIGRNIHTVTAQRVLHVEGEEIHSGGPGGGLSFADRAAAGGTFVEAPTAGERWVSYASGGSARLWSGRDHLTVDAATAAVTAPGGAQLKEVTVGTVGASQPGDPDRTAYHNPHETVGVAQPTGDLRLQSPGSVFVHTYDGAGPPGRRHRERVKIAGEGELARLTIGPGGNGRLHTRHIDGKDGGSDNDDGLYLNYATGKEVHVGGGLPADLVVHGGISWDGERSDQNYLRLGRTLICWGVGLFPNGDRQHDYPVGYPAGVRFTGTPAVTVQLNDTGYGTDRPRASLGAFPVVDPNTQLCESFHMVYKSDTNRSGDVYFTWIAIGRSA